MSRSQFSMTTFAPLIIGLAFLSSPVLGQTVSSPVVVPCAEETAPGRPTLKRRLQYSAEIDAEFRLVDQALNEGAVDLRVTIDEGRQFRIRSIKFEGSNVSEKELRNLLLIRAGDVFNQQLFEKSVNQLNETRWFEMIDKDKDTDFKTDEEEALLDITLRLKRVKSR